MDTARAIVLITCVISVLTSILHLLKPDSRFDRQLRLLLSAVTLLAILTPLSSGVKDLDISWSSSETVSPALSRAAEEETVAAAEENLSAALSAYLEENGISPAQVTVVMHTNDQGSIDIEQVTAFCADAETAAGLLTDCLGKEVKIHVEAAM